ETMLGAWWARQTRTCRERVSREMTCSPCSICPSAGRTRHSVTKKSGSLELCMRALSPRRVLLPEEVAQGEEVVVAAKDVFREDDRRSGRGPRLDGDDFISAAVLQGFRVLEPLDVGEEDLPVTPRSAHREPVLVAAADPGPSSSGIEDVEQAHKTGQRAHRPL